MDDIYHYIENETNDEPEFAHDAVMSRMKNPSPSRVSAKKVTEIVGLLKFKERTGKPEEFFLEAGLHTIMSHACRRSLKN